MNSVINVLIVVDTKSVADGNPLVYMMSDHPGDSSEGTADLTIKAKVGDIIHWRTTSVNTLDQVEIVAFDKESKGPAVVEQPYFTNLGWTTKAIICGEEDYTFTFSINGEGIFSWDPHVVIIPE